jgi:hypothetical protein
MGQRSIRPEQNNISPAPTARFIKSKTFHDETMVYAAMMARAFGPHYILGFDSRCVAPGWYGATPLALINWLPFIHSPSCHPVKIVFRRHSGTYRKGG